MEKSGDINSDAYKKLQAEIDDTESKLKDLRKQQKDLSDELGHPISPEQYDSLKREIIDTEAKLNDLEKQARNSFDAIAAIGKAGEALQDVGNKVTGIGEALAPLSAGAAGGLAAATKTFADFDAQLSKVAAIAGADEQAMKALKDEAIRLGGATKFSASEVAQAYEYMAMAGWGRDGPEKMLGGIEGILNLSAAGGTELARTSDIVTDAMTAMQIEVDKGGESAKHFADVLAVASSNSNTNVDMLGESFKYVTPLAGQLEYSIEDLSLALGLMANVGIKSGSAGKQLRNIFTNLAKPTEDVQKVIDKMGLSLDDGAGNMLSMRDVLLQLRSGFGDLKISQDEYQTRLADLTSAFEDGSLSEKDYDQNIQQLTKAAFGAEGAMKAQNAAMLAGKQNLAGLLAIVGASQEDFDALADALDHASDSADGYNGAAERMAAIMQDNLEGDVTALKSKIETLAISIGEILNPIIREIVRKLQDLMNWINGLDEPTKRMITTVGLIVAAAGPLLIVVGQIISSIGGLMAALPAVGAAFGGWAVPIGIAVAAIAALTGAISDGLGVSLEDMANMAKDVIGRIVQGILDGIPRLTDAAVKTMSGFADYLKDNLPTLMKSGLEIALKLSKSIRENAGKLVDGAIGLAKALAKGLADSIPTIIQNVPTIVSSIAGVINDNAPKILAAGVEIIITLVKGIIASIPVIIQELPKIIQAIWDVFTAFNWLALGANIVTAIKNGFVAMKNAIPDALHSIGDTAKTLFKNIQWGELGKSVVELIKGGITGMVKAIPDALASIANAAKNAFTSIDWKQIGKDLLKGIWNGITDLKGWLLDNVGKLVTSVMSVFTGKDGFDENSPSKWARKVGGYVTEGLADGLTGNVSDARNAASDAVRAVKGAFDWSSLLNAMDAATEPIRNALGTPLPSTYAYTPALQSASYGPVNAAYGVPAQTRRPAPVTFTVNNNVGGQRVAQLQYQYDDAEQTRRGASFIKKS